MKYTNTQGLPEVFLAMARKDKYNQEFKAWLQREGLEGHEHVISVTALNDSARFIEFKRRHGHEFTVDISRAMASIRGSIIHKLLEEGGLEQGETMVEERIHFMAKSRSGRCWAVTGAPDNVVTLRSGGILRDWKTCKAWAVMPGSRKIKSWEEQVNLYAPMVEKHLALPPWGYIKEVEIVAWIMDWSETTAEKNPDYPQAEVVRIPIPRWDQVKTHRHLLDRLAAHEAARYGTAIPECSEEERWQTVDGWAVTGRGNSRATKVFGTVFEAEEFQREKAPKIYDIEMRLSEPRRCMRWCPALPWCTQGQALTAPRPKEDDGLMAALQASLAKGGES